MSALPSFSAVIDQIVYAPQYITLVQNQTVYSTPPTTPNPAVVPAAPTTPATPNIQNPQSQSIVAPAPAAAVPTDNEDEDDDPSSTPFQRATRVLRRAVHAVGGRLRPARRAN